MGMARAMKKSLTSSGGRLPCVQALEQRVDNAVKQLRVLRDFVRALHGVQEKYAHEAGKLPFVLSDKHKFQLEHLPPLRRVCTWLQQLVHKRVHSALSAADDLADLVLAPLEMFTDQYTCQAKQLVTAVQLAVQQERALNGMLLRAEHSDDGSLVELTTHADDAGGSRESSNQWQHEDNDLDAGSGNQDEDSERKAPALDTIETMHKLRCARSSAYEKIALRLETLRELDHQHNLMRERMFLHVCEVFAGLAACAAEAISALEIPLQRASMEQVRVTDEEVVRSSDGPQWNTFLQDYALHGKMALWMSTLFAQLVIMDECMIKRLQKLSKSAAFANDCVPAAALLNGLKQYHRACTVNLLDPICRTLKFSQQKQQQIRKEVLQSLQDSHKRAAMHESKLWPFGKQSEDDPVNAMLESQTAKDRICDSEIDLHRLALRKSLQNTSLLGVKTMELMILDHLKHLRKAVTLLADAVASCQSTASEAFGAPEEKTEATEPAEEEPTGAADQGESSGSDVPVLFPQPAAEKHDETIGSETETSKDYEDGRGHDPTTPPTPECRANPHPAVRFAKTNRSAQSSARCIEQVGSQGTSVAYDVHLALLATLLLALVVLALRLHRVSVGWQDLARLQHNHAQEFAQFTLSLVQPVPMLAT